MLIIPAIDLSEGQVVRLVRGDRSQRIAYSDDPRGAARTYVEDGAPMIHVVDLDGAFAGSPRNAEVISLLCRDIPVPIQVGGGIRDETTIARYLDLGVGRVVLGTAAIEDPAFLGRAVDRFGDAIVGGLDVREGRIAVRGWEETLAEPALEVARRFAAVGLRRVVHTDIARDGTLTAPNVEASAALARETGLRVIVSGGISSLEHVRSAASHGCDGIEGMIVGRALYEGRFTLREAIVMVQLEQEG